MDLRTVQGRHLAAASEFPVEGPALLYGLAGWFEADLAPGITLRTAPDAPATCWQQCFFPLARPLRVPRRGKVEAEVRVTGVDGECHLTWEVEVSSLRGGRRERARGSTFSSSPLPREEVERRFAAARGVPPVSQVIGTGS